MVQVGTPDELFERPGDSFVAEQVGSPRMNLVPATSAGDGGSVRLPFGEVAGGPWAAALQRFPSARELLFGVRPHDVQPAEGDGARAALPRPRST